MFVKLKIEDSWLQPIEEYTDLKYFSNSIFTKYKTSLWRDFKKVKLETKRSYMKTNYSNFSTDMDFKEPHLSRYLKFIETRKLRKLFETQYTEKHHIIPKSYGGSNEKENLIKLSAREHFIAHMILWKGVGKKMTYAFSMLASTRKDFIKLTSRQYENLKKEIASLRKEKIGRRLVCLQTKEEFLSIREAEAKYPSIKVYDTNNPHVRKDKLIFMYKDDYNLLNKKEINKVYKRQSNIIKQRLKNTSKDAYQSKKIICPQKNEIFKSIKEASKIYKNVTDNLYSKIKRKDGLSFFYLEDYKSWKDKRKQKFRKYQFPRQMIICPRTGDIFSSELQARKKYGVVRNFLYNISKRKDGLQFFYLTEYEQFSLEEKENARKLIFPSNKTNSKIIICNETKEVFTSIREAEKKYGTGIYDIVTGKSKRNRKGLTFSYYDYNKNKKGN